MVFLLTTTRLWLLKSVSTSAEVSLGQRTFLTTTRGEMTTSELLMMTTPAFVAAFQGASTPQASTATTAVAMTWLERATVDGVTASEGLLTQMCPPAGNKLDTAVAMTWLERATVDGVTASE